MQNESNIIQQYFSQSHDFNNKDTHLAKISSHQVVEIICNKIESGKYKISEQAHQIDKLLCPQQIPEEIKIKLEKKRQNENRIIRNNLLYPRSKSNNSQHGNHATSILSVEEHHRLMVKIQKSKIQRQMRKQQISQKQRSIKQQNQKRSKEKEIQTISLEKQKRRSQIKQNLRKLKQNHEKFMQTEQQSNRKYRHIREKKRLHDIIKERYESNVLLPSLEEKKKRLKEIREMSKLDFQELVKHEKEYLYKRQQFKQRKTENAESERWTYRAPPHSDRINMILEQEKREKIFKMEAKRRMIEQKRIRTENFTEILKEKYLPKPKKHQKNEETISLNLKEKQDSKAKQIDRKTMGNQYLNDLRKMIKKKNTQSQRKVEIEDSQSENNKKRRQTTTQELPKKKKPLEIIKKAQIQKILKSQEGQHDKIRRIKLVNEKMENMLKMRQQTLKQKFSEQVSEDAVGLLLSSIQAKINLMQIYNNS